MRASWRAFRKSWKKPVNLIVVPYGPLAPWRFRFSMPFALFAAAVWTGVTVWAGYVAGRNLDYYVTKADNRLLRAKMAYVAGEIEQGRKYLAMTRQTEEQMRGVLGMGGKSAIIRNVSGGEGEGGAAPGEALSFRSLIGKKASEISESVFRRNISQITDESRRALASFQEIAWYIANQRNVYRATPGIWPASGSINSSFGYRMSPFSSDFGEFHSGVDVANRPETPIYATADGVVRHAGWAAGYGQAILIDHGFGFSTLYGHTAELKVKEGDKVSRGQIIARMGTTGRSTGCHVHYEVWVNGKPVNPMKYLKVGEAGKS
ncbi:MAG: M23 family metallopeptidase [Elusimicrobiales bacterium]|nr:M23 family metallopeptidase [Elusimicrobiales bacterium]